MRAMTEDEQKTAKELFTPAEIDPREGKTLLTVRFNPLTQAIYYGPHERKNRIVHKGATLLRYVVDETATTPTGGRYTRRQITVRALGKVWTGYLPHERKHTDVVHLKPVRP